MDYLLIAIALPICMCLFWGITLLILGIWKHTKRKYLLSALMLALSLVWVEYLLIFNQHYDFLLIWENIYLFAILSVSPLFYLYLAALMKKEPDIRLVWKIFLPACCIFIFSLVLYTMMSPEEHHAYIQYILYRDESGIRWTPLLKIQKIKLHLASLLLAAQIAALLFYSFSEINRYREEKRGTDQSVFAEMLVRFRLLLTLEMAVITFSLITAPLGRVGFFIYPKLTVVLMLFYGIVIFLIGCWGYKYYMALNLSTPVDASTNSSQDSRTTTGEMMKNEIIELLEKKEIFTQEGLKINDIARLLCTNRTYVSTIINTTMNTTFTDLINDYRVSYAKNILSDQTYLDLPLSEVRKMSGFSSDSSFYRIFKQKAGITPLDFKRLYNRPKAEKIRG